jgi:HEPN domain-containing protein
MPDPEAVAEVARHWMRRARADLAAARVILADREGLDPWVASFHAQQAAEKYLKAACVIEQVRFPRTHDLERLAQLLKTGWALPDERTLAVLSRYAVAGRYPEALFEGGPDPTWADAEEAVRLAIEVESAVVDGARSRSVDP